MDDETDFSLGVAGSCVDSRTISAASWFVSSFLLERLMQPV